MGGVSWEEEIGGKERVYLIKYGFGGIIWSRIRSKGGWVGFE